MDAKVAEWGARFLPGRTQPDDVRHAFEEARALSDAAGPDFPAGWTAWNRRWGVGVHELCGAAIRAAHAIAQGQGPTLEDRVKRGTPHPEDYAAVVAEAQDVDRERDLDRRAKSDDDDLSRMSPNQLLARAVRRGEAEIDVPNRRIILKDSGKREEFATGSRRDTREGKGRYDLLLVGMPDALRELAVLLERGAEKYGERNWEKGQPVTRYLDSAVRHLACAADGMEDEQHLIQAAWNALAAYQTRVRARRGDLPAELDDVPRRDA